MKSKTAYIILLPILLLLNACGPSEEDRKLIDEDRAKELSKKCKGTPAEFRGNYLMHPARWDRLRIGGELKPRYPEMIEEGRERLRNIYSDIEIGLKWKTPVPQIKIPYTAQSPEIDGNIDSDEWKNAYICHGSFNLSTEQKRIDSDEIWKLMWDENNLYAAISFKDKNIIAPELERDSGIYLFDCMEIFIMTEPRLKTYWEIVINSSKSIFDALHTASEVGGWEYKLYESIKLSFSVNVKKDMDGVSICTFELAMPWQEMPGYMKGNKPHAGEFIHINFLHLDLAEEGGKPVYYSFKPLLYDGHNIYGMTKCELVR